MANSSTLTSNTSAAWGDPPTWCNACGQSYYGITHQCIPTHTGSHTVFRNDDTFTWGGTLTEEAHEKMREVVRDAIEQVFEKHAQEHYKTATFTDLETIMAMIKAVARNLETYINENELSLPI